MKTTMGVADFDSVSKRSLERARKMMTGAPIKAERRITFARSSDFAAFLASSRHGVLEAVMQQPRSVSELAQALNRSRAAVSRDVNALKELGLVRLDRHTRNGRVEDGMVRAVAKRIELRAQLTA